MHIATETKTGVTLHGDQYDEADVQAFRQSFKDADAVIVLSPDAAAQRARTLCAAHIERHYPTYKQFNLLRSGTKAEKDKMDTFINACRDWSNGENPDPAALEAIQP